MDGIQIIDQVISAVRNQWEDALDVITHAFQPETPLMEKYIKIMGIGFRCLIENEINGRNFLRIEEKAKNLMDTCKEPIILIARYVQPSVYGALRKMGLNFADTAGNYNIQYTKGKKMIFYFSHTGEKAPVNNKKNYPVFQEAGLKVIFYLLQAPENVSKPFREIKEYSGVSIGTVKNVIDELENRKFILSTQKKRVLKERRLLLDLWSENYNQVLKPKLLLKQLDFRTPEQKEKWKEMALPDGMLWGGECASNLLNGYLTPEFFELYTEIPFSNLMKTGAIRTTEGVINVYQKFWKGSTMPYVLIYADLVSKGDGRCIEAANKLLKDELSDFE
ncbi:type IV toxin-antitoxin system AbiEi family antitoxin [Porphyromonas loveana]|uniref:Uncharacterized protein n=2 Tax=Bacteroidales TaxID=171549 RepID=A0A2U1FHB5_9PORP|nr:type IV toxin-antitoxin system AbiEi family antitoxin [Porphyromonas loveana]PVZ11546.1 hypothetical protein C7382_1066 [Porphyromonas loveana]